eukprot:166260-Pleurochrysis_carterae.AAC.5
MPSGLSCRQPAASCQSGGWSNDDVPQYARCTNCQAHASFSSKAAETNCTSASQRREGPKKI